MSTLHEVMRAKLRRRDPSTCLCVFTSFLVGVANALQTVPFKLSGPKHYLIAGRRGIRLYGSGRFDNAIENVTTVRTVTSPKNQQITIVGTAHLSIKSVEQVESLIAGIQPNAVVVELDMTRLRRIGIRSIDDINLNVTTADDIQLPEEWLQLDHGPIPLWFKPLFAFQELVTNIISRVIRVLLTNMYNDLSDRMQKRSSVDDAGVRGGGGSEFWAAIRAAESCPSCTRLVLGDRSSLTTIQRAALFAFQSGNPMLVLQRMQRVNADELEQLSSRIRQELVTSAGGTNSSVTDEDVQVQLMEYLKEDNTFRDRLFKTLEMEVPEFTRAFLKERDYIMARSIERILVEPEIQRVVVVVGAAHVSGIQENFRALFGLEKQSV